MLAFSVLATMTRINVSNAKYRLDKLTAQCSKIATMCTILSVTFVFYGSSPNAGRLRGEPLVDTDLGVGLDLLMARLEKVLRHLSYDSAPGGRRIRVAIQLSVCVTVLWFTLCSYVAIKQDTSTRCLFRYRAKHIQAAFHACAESCARSSLERFFSAILPLVFSALWLPFLFRPLMLRGKVTTCCLQAARLLLSFKMCFLMYRQIPLTVQLSTIQQSQDIVNLYSGSNLTNEARQKINRTVAYIFRGACTRVVEQAGIPTFFFVLLLLNAITGVWPGCFRNSCPTSSSVVPPNLAYPRLGTSSPYRPAEDRYQRLFGDSLIPIDVSRELGAVVGRFPRAACNGTIDGESVDNSDSGLPSCRHISLKEALFCPSLPLLVPALHATATRAEPPVTNFPYNVDLSSVEPDPLHHESRVKESPLIQLFEWVVGTRLLQIPSPDPFRTTHKWTRELTDELRSLVPGELIGSMTDLVLCLCSIIYSCIWIISALETRMSHLSCVGANAYGPSQTDLLSCSTKQ
eukprot:GHVS01085535.1.p1 GENE.GHVS01085535.1~~GHVS01085535.1.p1  ORF type:complete len:580 (+),score=4.79 GHVS01085535.1:190-1740(+)